MLVTSPAPAISQAGTWTPYLVILSIIGGDLTCPNITNALKGLVELRSVGGIYGTYYPIPYTQGARPAPPTSRSS